MPRRSNRSPSATGRGKVYSRQYTYPDNWKDITKAVKQRDGYRCKKCGRTKEEVHKRGHFLETHHIRSARTGNHRKTNLVTLCSECHATKPKHEHLKDKARKNKLAALQSGGLSRWKRP